jgi:iron donor protein CyaY
MLVQDAPKTMDEQEFRTRADQALEDLYRRLSAAAERHEFEADFNSGALVIEFEDPPAKFVVSPNAPVSQVWVSAQMKSFKLDWDPARNAFVTPDSGQTLVELVAAVTGQQIGEEVSL